MVALRHYVPDVVPRSDSRLDDPMEIPRRDSPKRLSHADSHQTHALSAMTRLNNCRAGGSRSVSAIAAASLAAAGALLRSIGEKYSSVYPAPVRPIAFAFIDADKDFTLREGPADQHNDRRVARCLQDPEAWWVVSHALFIGQPWRRLTLKVRGLWAAYGRSNNSG